MPKRKGPDAGERGALESIGGGIPDATGNVDRFRILTARHVVKSAADQAPKKELER